MDTCRVEDFQKFQLKLRTSLTLSLYRNREENFLFFSSDGFHYQWWLFTLKLEKPGNKFEERLHILIFVLKRITFFIIVHIICICQLQCMYLVFEFLKMCSVNHRASYQRINAFFFQFSVICNVTINGVHFKTNKKTTRKTTSSMVDWEWYIKWER